MLNQLLTIARKEVTDSWRDRRAVLSAAVYSMMGPVVVSLVSLAVRGRGTQGESQSVLIAMSSVFTLVSAFVGGMNVAMDSVAGERERRSLLPLLMHPVTRLDVLLGKWAAVAVFSIAGLALNLLGFALLLQRVPPWPVALCLLSLSLLAAAVELWISTVCRGVKEANTYLSMLVFLPMGLGMFMVFSPVAGQRWWNFLPVAGQQLQLEASMKGTQLDVLPILFLTLATAVLAALALLAAADRLEQDNVVTAAEQAVQERELADAAREELAGRFDRLLAENGGALSRLAGSYTNSTADRDDLVQEIALALWRALPHFRGECSERTFLFRIAHNRAVTYLTRRPAQNAGEDAAIEVPDSAPNPEAGLARNQQGARLRGAVRSLPLLYRQVVMLMLEGMEYDEMAQVLGISESNVGTRLSRARQMLRQLMEVTR